MKDLSKKKIALILGAKLFFCSWGFSFTHYSVPEISTDYLIAGALTDNPEWGFGSGVSTAWRSNPGAGKIEVNSTYGRAAFADFFETSAKTYSLRLDFKLDYRTDFTGYGQYFGLKVSLDGTGNGPGFQMTQYGDQTYAIRYVNGASDPTVSYDFDSEDRLSVAEVWGTATPANGDQSILLSADYQLTKKTATNSWSETLKLLVGGSVVQTIAIDGTATSDLAAFTDELHPVLIGPSKSQLNWRADILGIEFAAVPEVHAYQLLMGIVVGCWALFRKPRSLGRK